MCRRECEVILGDKSAAQCSNEKLKTSLNNAQARYRTSANSYIQSCFSALAVGRAVQLAPPPQCPNERTLHPTVCSSTDSPMPRNVLWQRLTVFSSECYHVLTGGKMAAVVYSGLLYGPQM